MQPILKAKKPPEYPKPLDKPAPQPTSQDKPAPKPTFPDWASI